jgi:hypothetical protein
MNYSKNLIYIPGRIVAGMLFGVVVAAASGQVLPSEVSNPRARVAESKYLPQLESLQKEIGTASFPHPFQLARYVNARSGRAAMDQDGIEFVSFQHRTVLKVSGVYKVAFEAGLQSENQRAIQTLVGAGVPILRLATAAVPDEDDYDGIGLEIVYGTRDTNKEYSFEGREALSVVFNRADAHAFVNASSDAARQEILNRSDLYINGKPYGVVLGQRDGVNAGSGESSSNDSRPADDEVSRAATLLRASVSKGSASRGDAAVEPSTTQTAAPAAKSDDKPVLEAKLDPPTGAMSRDVHAASSQSERETVSLLEKSGDQVLMHVKVQNSLKFDGANSSIYKRAAQSFDLFLAPGMRDLVNAVPVDAKFDAFKFSVVNHVANGLTSSETIDYICPESTTRAFLENKITGQDLINQSTVLVNGMRIGLNLAAVE